MQNVIEWEAKTGEPRVERAEHPTTLARIDETAGLLKEARRSRPRYVVEVSAHHHGLLGITHAFSDDEQLSVALERFVAFSWSRRTRMHTIQPHGRAVVEPNLRLDRGDVLLDEEIYGRIEERQTRVHEHAVRVRQRALDGMAMRPEQHVETLAPPVVRLDEQQHVGVSRSKHADQTIGCAVRLQHV